MHDDRQVRRIATLRRQMALEVTHDWDAVLKALGHDGEAAAANDPI